MENWVVVHKKTVSLSRMLRKGAKNTVFPKILLLQPPPPNIFLLDPPLSALLPQDLAQYDSKHTQERPDNKAKLESQVRVTYGAH